MSGPRSTSVRRLNVSLLVLNLLLLALVAYVGANTLLARRSIHLRYLDTQPRIEAVRADGACGVWLRAPLERCGRACDWQTSLDGDVYRVRVIEWGAPSSGRLRDAAIFLWSPPLSRPGEGRHGPFRIAVQTRLGWHEQRVTCDESTPAYEFADVTRLD